MRLKTELTMVQSLKPWINGIQFCKELQLNKVSIESDSAIVVGWLEKIYCSLRYLWDFWEILAEELHGLTFTFTHIFREQGRQPGCRFF